VGLWVQNIGVRATELPPAVTERAAAEPDTTPEAMEGWMWASLERGTFLDLDELNALAGEAAAQEVEL
jgi:hypothetical protein